MFLLPFLSMLAAQPADPSTVPFAQDIAAFQAADARAMPARCQTLLVGSSSIRLWPNPASDLRTPVVQRGFGGSTIADVNRHFDAVVAPYRPSRILFYAGDNDLDSGRGVEGVTADFRDFLARKDRTLGATPVYFIAVKPSVARAAQLPLQRTFNARVRALAAKRSDLIFVDIAAPMMRGATVGRGWLLEDGLHLNAAGYALWTRVVRASFARERASRAPGCAGGR